MITKDYKLVLWEVTIEWAKIAEKENYYLIVEAETATEALQLVLKGEGPTDSIRTITVKWFVPTDCIIREGDK